VPVSGKRGPPSTKGAPGVLAAPAALVAGGSSARAATPVIKITIAHKIPILILRNTRPARAFFQHFAKK